jgi:hypothetical protein
MLQNFKRAIKNRNVAEACDRSRNGGAHSSGMPAKRYEIFEHFHILSGPISTGESVQGNEATNAILNATRKSCDSKAEVYSFWL